MDFNFFSNVHSNRRRYGVNIWVYIYNLTRLLNYKDSTDDKNPLESYPEKEKKETAVHYFSCVKYPYTALQNIRTLKYSPMCNKLSIFFIVKLFLGSCL